MMSQKDDKNSSMCWIALVQRYNFPCQVLKRGEPVSNISDVGPVPMPGRFHEVDEGLDQLVTVAHPNDPQIATTIDFSTVEHVQCCGHQVRSTSPFPIFLFASFVFSMDFNHLQGGMVQYFCNVDIYEVVGSNSVCVSVYFKFFVGSEKNGCLRQVEFYLMFSMHRTYVLFNSICCQDFFELAAAYRLRVNDMRPYFYYLLYLIFLYCKCCCQMLRLSLEPRMDFMGFSFFQPRAISIFNYKYIKPLALFSTNQMHFDCFHGHMKNLQMSWNGGENVRHPV
jgi:hypothetical protein